MQADGGGQSQQHGEQPVGRSLGQVAQAVGGEDDHDPGRHDGAEVGNRAAGAQPGQRGERQSPEGPGDGRGYADLGMARRCGSWCRDHMSGGRVLYLSDKEAQV
ncbi:hypothetical protein GCM10009827_056910 [Dactylosporangium maewongense]|uniref:Uncharacterized protein n=1 Tax=Dactylosporangium maewongense TaxID=634393 RepID=A0ABP4LUC8_9ACTN